MSHQTAEKLIEFIARSPSPFHVADNLCRTLEAAGYRPLQEHADWSLVPGGRYYVTRSGSALAAFRIPSGPWHGLLLTASHSDAPAFRLREHWEMEGPDGYLRLNAERYGGMLSGSWLDRPLSAAGRVLVRTADGIESRLVNIDRDLLLIPSVAVHMDREAALGRKYDPKTDLVPLLGTAADRGAFAALLAQAAGAEELVAADLFLYLRQRGTVWGAGGEFLSAPRLDDLQCVYACTQGFLSAEEGENLPVLCVLDSEEIGSATRQGAGGTFLREVLERICTALGRSLPAVLAGSFLVSADNAHAVHPNHPEYADPAHRPRLNGGVVVKHSPRYTTDALSQAVFTELCRRADVPVQHFANRSDLAGGSTLGNIAMAGASMNSVDVGLPQLAMHASYETAGAADTDYLIRALTTYYACSFQVEADGKYRL